jgi:hypothetical protein
MAEEIPTSLGKRSILDENHSESREDKRLHAPLSWWAYGSGSSSASTESMSDTHHQVAQICKGMLQQVLDNNQCLTDLTFVLDDMSRIRAHKGVMSERSIYMRQMLCSNMLEATKGEVRVRECSKASFLAFLEFMYTAMLGCRVNAVELWKVADLFDVQDLKEFLKSSLSDNPIYVPGMSVCMLPKNLIQATVYACFSNHATTTYLEQVK